MVEEIITTQMPESGRVYGKTNSRRERRCGAASGILNCPELAARREGRFNSNKNFRRVILK